MEAPPVTTLPPAFRPTEVPPPAEVIKTQGKLMLVPRGDIPRHQGDSNKMDFLRQQDPDNPETIPFQLRLGSQIGAEGSRLSFKLNEKGEIVSPDDVRVPGGPQNESVGAAEDAWVLEKQADGRLAIQFGNKTTSEIARFTQQELANGTVVIPLSKDISLGITSYNPDTNEVSVYRVKTREGIAPPVFPPTTELPPWKRIVTGAITMGALGGNDGNVTEPIVEPQTPVSGYVEQATGMPSQAAFDNQVVVEKDWPKETVDPSLKCPATERREVKAGDSLAGLLIKVNGLPRYLDENAKLDEKQVYADLLCTIYSPKNREQLRKSDPKAAEALDDLEKHTDLTGPITAEMVKAVMEKINQPERVKGASPQLLITYEGDVWEVPDFRPESPAV